MANSAQIRTAIPDDASVIQALSHSIWPRVYAKMISKEQMDYMLNWMYNIDTLREQMEHKGIQFLLLETDRPIGFAGFGPSDNGRYKLHKLYVDPDYHGNGYGQLLMGHILKHLPENCSGIELQVNKTNPAKSFYERLGFVVEEEAVFDIGQGFVMDDYIMFKAISPL
jgi:diamine N-acetyltransferase